MEQVTLTEAMDELEGLLEDFNIWLKRTNHLNISLVWLIDDSGATPGGYMTFRGPGDRIICMMETVRSVMKQGEEACQKMKRSQAN